LYTFCLIVSVTCFNTSQYYACDNNIIYNVTCLRDECCLECFIQLVTVIDALVCKVLQFTPYSWSKHTPSAQFYTVYTIFSDFQIFRPEYHWRDLSRRNAHLVHQNWYRISFTLGMQITSISEKTFVHFLKQAW
jgi:hypothetical protein